MRITVNVAVLAALLAVRCGPHLWHDWRQKRLDTSVERAKREEAEQLKAEREALEKLQESRSRRLC